MTDATTGVGAIGTATATGGRRVILTGAIASTTTATATATVTATATSTTIAATAGCHARSRAQGAQRARGARPGQAAHPALGQPRRRRRPPHCCPPRGPPPPPVTTFEAARALGWQVPAVGLNGSGADGDAPVLMVKGLTDSTGEGELLDVFSPFGQARARPPPPPAPPP
eukprot:1747106-Prymnesium_polylepis.2